MGYATCVSTFVWLRVVSPNLGKSTVLAELMAEGNTVDVCCKWDSVGQGGPLLSPPQLEGLAELGLDFWFDVYFAGKNGVV